MFSLFALRPYKERIRVLEKNSSKPQLQVVVHTEYFLSDYPYSVGRRTQRKWFLGGREVQYKQPNSCSSVGNPYSGFYILSSFCSYK